MTDIRRYPLFAGFGDAPAVPLSVETLSHAARYAYDRPPSADIVVLESADAMTPYLDSIDDLARGCRHQSAVRERDAGGLNGAFAGQGGRARRAGLECAGQW